MPGRKLARMAFMVDFSFTWLSVEPSKCPSNTSDNKQRNYADQTDNLKVPNLFGLRYPNRPVR